MRSDGEWKSEYDRHVGTVHIPLLSLSLTWVSVQLYVVVEVDLLYVNVLVHRRVVQVLLNSHLFIVPLIRLGDHSFHSLSFGCWFIEKTLPNHSNYGQDGKDDENDPKGQQTLPGGSCRGRVGSQKTISGWCAGQTVTRTWITTRPWDKISRRTRGHAESTQKGVGVGQLQEGTGTWGWTYVTIEIIKLSTWCAGGCRISNIAWSTCRVAIYCSYIQVQDAPILYVGVFDVG